MIERGSDPGNSLPFDVQQNRTVFYDFDIEGVERTKQHLSSLIKGAEEQGGETEASRTIKFQLTRDAKNPLESVASEMMGILQEIRSAVAPRGLLALAHQYYADLSDDPSTRRGLTALGGGFGKTAEYLRTMRSMQMNPKQDKPED